MIERRIRIPEKVNIRRNNVEYKKDFRKATKQKIEQVKGGQENIGRKHQLYVDILFCEKMNMESRY